MWSAIGATLGESDHFAGDCALDAWRLTGSSEATVPRFSLLLVLAAGCGENLTGRWSGTCDFDDGTYAYAADIDADFTDGRGHRVEGKLSLLMWDDRTLKGDLTGDRNAEFLELEAEMPTDGSIWVFSTDGELKASVYEGDCGLQVPGGGGALAGVLRMEK